MEPGASCQAEERLNTRGDGGVVKIGTTVRRSTGAWTPTVHALLAYLHESGCDFAPRLLGIDEDGREILSYIEGDTQMTLVADRVWYDALPEAARRLRQLHDLTARFVPADGAIWRDEADGNLPRLERSASGDGAEVICHGDWGTHNAVFKQRRLVGMIDGTFARPEHRSTTSVGSRSGGAPWLLPTSCCPVCPIPSTHLARLHQLCDAYGLEARGGVLGAVVNRLETFIRWLEVGAAAGDPHPKKRVDAGEAIGHRRRLK